MSCAASRSGTVVHLDVLAASVMWPLVERRVLLDHGGERVICSGVMPPIGSLTRIIWTSAWRWP
jgi:hypothetical protein